ncbi:MAG: TetR/AcrR family transcriptional regulator, partial [Sphingomonadales bacterium]
MAMELQPDKNWHYPGDLKAALATAGLELVAAAGPDALTLRAVARMAGVSAMAPYHHFRDRTALVAAVATLGFQRLFAAKQQALALAPTDPAAQLEAGSAAYVRFARDNPGLYRLMKSAELADRSAHPDLASAAAEPGASLARLLAALAAAGRLGDTRPAEAAALLWAMVHGLALLSLDGYLT